MHTVEPKILDLSRLEAGDSTTSKPMRLDVISCHIGSPTVKGCVATRSFVFSFRPGGRQQLHRAKSKATQKTDKVLLLFSSH